MSNTGRSKERTQSDLLTKLKSMAQEAREAKTAHEVAGEAVDVNVTVTSLFSDLKVEKTTTPRSGQSFAAAERKLREQQRNDLSEEQREFLEKRARLRRQQSTGR